MATASASPITAGAMSLAPSDARRWKAIAPIDSSDEADRCGDSDRRPHQTDEHTGDPGEFARADQPPLQRLEPEVITDGQGLGNAEQFDARGECEERRKQDRHDYGGGVHHRAA